MTISPGSFPNHGICAFQESRIPKTTNIKPITIKAFPNPGTIDSLYHGPPRGVKLTSTGAFDTMSYPYESTPLAIQFVHKFNFEITFITLRRGAGGGRRFASGPERRARPG